MDLVKVTTVWKLTAKVIKFDFPTAAISCTNADIIMLDKQLRKGASQSRIETRLLHISYKEVAISWLCPISIGSHLIKNRSEIEAAVQRENKFRQAN